MEIKYLQTIRKVEKKLEWDLVYEWEDVIENQLPLTFKYESKLSKYKNGIVKYSKINPFVWENLFRSNDLILRFDMNAKDYDNYYNRSNMVHWIIDFWIEEKKLANFVKAYDRCPLVLISSKEAYDMLCKKNLGLNMAHLPLSLSDKYRITAETRFDKTIDLLIFGRPNPVLSAYCWKYADENPSFTFAYLKKEGYEFNYYTNKGKLLGNCRDRKDALNLLRAAKIGLYTTPSMDNNKVNTNGYNQVTPRFLELIASGCHIIARYADNSDTEYYELDKFCPNTISYDHFKEQVKRALSCDVDMTFYSDYLKKHYTSYVIKEFSKLLSSL